MQGKLRCGERLRRKGEGLLKLRAREVEGKSLIMRLWKQMMQLEITRALFDSAFRSGVFIHNY